MNFTLVNILLGVIAIVLFFILLKFLKDIFYATVTVMAFLIVALIGMSIIVYMDATELRQDFRGDKVIAFEYEDEIVGGIDVKSDGSRALLGNGSNITHFTSDRLSAFQQRQNTSENQSLTLIIDVESINSSYEVMVANRTVQMDANKFRQVLESDDISEIEPILLQGAERQLLPYKDVVKLRSIVISNGFIREAYGSGPNFLLTLLREGHLKIQPEYRTATIVKNLPEAGIGE